MIKVGNLQPFQYFDVSFMHAYHSQEMSTEAVPFPFHLVYLRQNIILKYVCHLCLCGPNCTWNTTYCPVNQSCWVNNFLMYMMHDTVIESGVWPCHAVCVLLYLFSCTRSLCHQTFDCLKKSCSLMPSHALYCQWKSTQESLATNCVFFLKGLQWMCATHLCKVF